MVVRDVEAVAPHRGDVVRRDDQRIRDRRPLVQMAGAQVEDLDRVLAPGVIDHVEHVSGFRIHVQEDPVWPEVGVDVGCEVHEPRARVLEIVGVDGAAPGLAGGRASIVGRDVGHTGARMDRDVLRPDESADLAASAREVGLELLERPGGPQQLQHPAESQQDQNRQPDEDLLHCSDLLPPVSTTARARASCSTISACSSGAAAIDSASSSIPVSV